MEHSRVEQVNLADRSARTVTAAAIPWHTADGPLLLVVDATAIANTSVDVTQRDGSARTAVPALISDRPTELSMLVAEILAQPSQATARVALDRRAGDEGFESLWVAACEALSLAHDGLPWVDSTGRLKCLVVAATEGSLWDRDRAARADAWLCLTSGDLSGPSGPNDRVVVLSLA